MKVRCRHIYQRNNRTKKKKADRIKPVLASYIILPIRVLWLCIMSMLKLLLANENCIKILLNQYHIKTYWSIVLQKKKSI